MSGISDSEIDSLRNTFMKYKIEHPLVKKGKDSIKISNRNKDSDEVSSDCHSVVVVDKEEVEALVEEGKECFMEEENNNMVQMKEVEVVLNNGNDTTVYTMVKPESKDEELVVGSEEEAEQEGELNLLQKAKKAGVAVGGGAMVAVGIPLIPLPGTSCTNTIM